MHKASECLWAEALEKVDQGLAQLVNWDTIKDDQPVNLKIFPLAAIPHKSHKFRAILDLSFQICMGGIPMPSVNSAMCKQAKQLGMHQL